MAVSSQAASSGPLLRWASTRAFSSASALLRFSALRIFAQLAADAFPNGRCRCVMAGVLRQVELATLPSGAAEHGFASGLQAGMIVGGDELHAAHAARDQVFQKGPPQDAVIGNFGLKERHRHAENTAAAIWPDPDCRQHGSVTHDPALP